MKNIIAYLKSFFYNKKTEPHFDNQLMVRVDKDGRIFVNFDIQHFSQNDCDNFASMLYYMNEGFYVGTILDLLLHLGKQDSRYVDFMDKVVHKWSKLLTEHNHMQVDIRYQKPIIAPSEFYKLTGYTK